MLTLDSAGDPVAEHHTLGGRKISSLHSDWRGLPVLPFSVMAEMLAEAAARLVPGKLLVALRNVRAHKWIRYEVEPVALELRATLDPDRPDSVKVAIHNRGLARSIRPVEAPVFEGVAVFGYARPGAAGRPAVRPDRPASLPVHARVDLHRAMAVPRPRAPCGLRDRPYLEEWD